MLTCTKSGFMLFVLLESPVFLLLLESPVFHFYKKSNILELIQESKVQGEHFILRLHFPAFETLDFSTPWLHLWHSFFDISVYLCACVLCVHNIQDRKSVV